MYIFGAVYYYVYINVRNYMYGDFITNETPQSECKKYLYILHLTLR